MKHAVCEAVAAEAPDVGCGDTTHFPVSREAGSGHELMIATLASRGQTQDHGSRNNGNTDAK